MICPCLPLHPIHPIQPQPTFLKTYNVQGTVPGRNGVMDAGVLDKDLEGREKFLGCEGSQLANWKYGMKEK